MLRLGTRSQSRAVPVPAEIRDPSDAPSLAQNRRMISKLAQGNPSDNSPALLLTENYLKQHHYQQGIFDLETIREKAKVSNNIPNRWKNETGRKNFYKTQLPKALKLLRTKYHSISVTSENDSDLRMTANREIKTASVWNQFFLLVRL